jgi:hypothetical protein
MMSTTLLKVAHTEQLLYGRKSAAGVLDLSVHAVDRLIACGQLHAIRIAARILVTAESVRRLAGANRVDVGLARELSSERWSSQT